MIRYVYQRSVKNSSIAPVLAWIVLFGATLAARSVSAQTYISAEPIPSVQIVGQADLAKIEGLGYSTLALWSQRLLYDCGIVQNVIFTLSDNRAISTILPSIRASASLREDSRASLTPRMYSGSRIRGLSRRALRISSCSTMSLATS
jgi:hypothetical protein